MLRPGCTRKKLVHFCHTSEKKCDQISCVKWAPMFLGKQQVNLQGSRRLVIGSRCACDNFRFFFLKTNATPIGENGKKLVQQARLQRSRFPALRQANFFASAFYRALDSKQQLVFNEPLFAALRKTKFSIAAREL